MRRTAKGMNENYCPGSRRDCCLGYFGVDIQGHGIYVDQDRAGAFVQCGISGRNEAERCRDDFVAFANTQPAYTQVQSAGARIDCHGMAGATVISNRALELGQHWTQAQPAGPEHLDCHVNLGTRDIRLRQRDSHRWALLDGESGFDAETGFDGETGFSGTGRLVRSASPSGTLVSTCVMT